MKQLLITFLAMISIISCGPGNVMDWSKLPYKIDGSLNASELERQLRLNPDAWKTAYDFLMNTDLSALAPGRHDLDDHGTFANVQEYETKDSSHFEAHRRYVDIQILTSGKEYIFISPSEGEKLVVSPYSEENDIEFFDKEEYAERLLDGSNMIILFPCDAHMPCMKVNENESVRKVVIKIPYK